jgi:hypothetical protein
MKFFEIKAKMKAIENDVHNLWNKHSDLEKLLTETCDHRNTSIRIGCAPASGMSDDRARSGYYETKVCEDCGKLVAERHESYSLGDWYEYD